MALSYLQRSALTGDDDFRGRVRVASLQVAVNIKGETSSGHTYLDLKRDTLCDDVIRMGETPGPVLSWLVWTIAVSAALPDPGAATDADLFSAVNAAWNDVAGVTAADMTL